MEYIPNQPVSLSVDTSYFNGVVNCSSDEVPYLQIVDNTDITQFQVSIDPCPDAIEVLENPDFATADGWDLQANWAFGTNSLCATEATASIESTDILAQGYYKFTIVVTSFSGDGIDFNFDGVTLATITSVGTYELYGFAGVAGATIELIPTGTTSICFSQISGFEINTDVEVFVMDEEQIEIANIDNVSNPEYFTIVKNTVTVEIAWASLGVANQCAYLIVINPCNGGQLISNMFSIGDYADKCTILINACNNNDSLGFIFTDSGFSPRIRLEAKLRQSSYTNEKTVYETALGETQVYNFKRKKFKTLAIDLQPEYVHDFLSTLSGYDNLYLSNIAYYVEDSEYNVVYSSSSDNFGTVNITVGLKTQNVKNILCSNNENSCNLA